MSVHVLYQDRTTALSDDAVILRGFTRILGRARRVQLSQISGYRVRHQSEFPNSQLPRWGLDDRGVWYTRDPRRWRRQASIEITFHNGEVFGFSPAHPTRFAELLNELGVKSL